MREPADRDKFRMGAIEPLATPSAGLETRHKQNKDVLKYPLWFGGSSACMAVCLTHPLDLSTIGHQVLLVSRIMTNTRGSQGKTSGFVKKRNTRSD
jgi:hypothetical protein